MLRVVFMGTPEIAVPTLAEVMAAGHEVVAVYSQPPRPAGRGMELRKSSVHVHAEAAGIPVLTPRSLKGEAEQAVMRDGPEVVTVFRPSVIIGSRHTPAFLAGGLSMLAALIPARYRPIRTTDIARAMVTAALADPRSRAILAYADMKALIAGAG